MDKIVVEGGRQLNGEVKISGAKKQGTLEHAVKTENLYPFLINEEGNWTERKDVRNVRVMGSGTGTMRVFNNEWMTIKGNIGPEIGIGHHVGHVTDAPVMILKSCIGNRALGWDLLPPGSEGFEFTDDKGVTWIHPGYKGSPERWEKGTEPKPIGWYAGLQDVTWDYNHKSGKWTLPTGPRVGRVMKLGSQPVNLFGAVYYNPNSDGPTATWTAKINLTLLFPK